MSIRTWLRIFPNEQFPLLFVIHRLTALISRYLRPFCKQCIMKNDNEQANILKAYNMLFYFAGSMIMNEPTEECILDFWTKGTLKRLPVKSSNPRFIKAASILRESCGEKDLCREMLCDDFYRLFDKRGLHLAPAIESDHINKRNSSFINGESAGDFYKSYRWKPATVTEVPDDHLGIELLFITRLIDNYIQIDDDPSRHEMKNEIKRFIDEHILTWISVWDKSVQGNALTLCYKGISSLIYACIEDIRSILS